MKGEIRPSVVYKIALTIIVVIIMGGIFLWQSKSDKYGSPESWSVFNQDYQSPYRRFSFKYPSAFQVADPDSASVYLYSENDGETLLLIDQEVFLDIHSNRTAHEQFEYYYANRKRRNKKLPDLTMIERIDFNENNFVYKFTEVHEKTSPGVKIAHHDEWNHYLGILEGNGVSVYDLKKLPEDVVLEIIRSIEFE